MACLYSFFSFVENLLSEEELDASILEVNQYSFNHSYDRSQIKLSEHLLNFMWHFYFPLLEQLGFIRGSVFSYSSGYF